MDTPDREWSQLLDLARLICLRQYGAPPVAISLHLPMLGEWRSPILPTPAAQTPPASPVTPADRWATGDDPKHTDGFRVVYWPGLGEFRLTPKQAVIVEELWDARFGGGHPDRSQETLLRAADSNDVKLCNLFKRSPAWGVLVVQGVSPGTYRLPELPGEGDQDDGEDA